MKKNIALLIEGFVIILFLFNCASNEVKKAKEFMDAGMYEQAIQLLEIEIQANPKNAESSFLLGKCFLQTENTQKVEEYFNRAILLNSDFKKDVGNIFFEKSLEQYKKDDASKASSYLERGIKYNPSGKEEFAVKLYDYANEYSVINTDPTKTIRIYNVVNHISPNYKSKIAGKSYSLAKSFIEKGFVKEGFEYADFGINFDPIHIKDVAELYFNYANSLLTSLNKPSESVFYFDRCITLNPSKKIEVGNIYYNQAKIFEINNDISLTLLFAKKSKEINPDYNLWYKEITEKYKPKLPTTGLVAYFPFNGNANDEAPYNYYKSSVKLNFGYDSNANPRSSLILNGNGFIELSSSALNNMTSGTIYARIKLAYVNAQHTIVDKTITGDINYFQLIVDNNNRLRVIINNEYFSGIQILAKNVYYDIACTFNGQKLAFYINGIKDSEYKCKQQIVDSKRPVLIGKVDNNTAFFNGNMDNIRIYNRALSESEIKALYNEGK